MRHILPLALLCAIPFSLEPLVASATCTGLSAQTLSMLPDPSEVERNEDGEQPMVRRLEGISSRECFDDGWQFHLGEIAMKRAAEDGTIRLTATSVGLKETGVTLIGKNQRIHHINKQINTRLT